jgi:hypothetical protein
MRQDFQVRYKESRSSPEDFNSSSKIIPDSLDPRMTVYDVVSDLDSRCYPRKMGQPVYELLKMVGLEEYMRRSTYTSSVEARQHCPTPDHWQWNLISV